MIDKDMMVLHNYANKPQNMFKDVHIYVIVYFKSLTIFAFVIWSWNVRVHRDSSVSIVTEYGVDGQGFIPGRGKMFLTSTASRLVLWPTQPPTYTMGTWSRVSGLKLPGCEADYSSPSSAKVKNSGTISPLPVCLHGIMINQLSTRTMFPLILYKSSHNNDYISILPS
jgi:hypothetical protein